MIMGLNKTGPELVVLKEKECCIGEERQFGLITITHYEQSHTEAQLTHKKRVHEYTNCRFSKQIDYYIATPPPTYSGFRECMYRRLHSSEVPLAKRLC